ncbi:MAG: hypothetical protein ACKV19_21700 [Verrucomicrobiales bacterium]
MRVLLTNHELARRTGTEWLTAELAVELRSRGHQVAVFTWALGEMATRVAAAGVPVVDDPARIPFRPDIIHGQHHLATMAALTAWPRVPGLFYCHGVQPFDEFPPRHPRLQRYLSMAAINNEWLAQAAAITTDRVATVPNWFDPARFVTVRHPGAPADAAALYSNRIRSGPLFETVRDACRRQGLSLSGLGHGFGSPVEAPETVLPKFAVVFATGRSALEALACGCAVIPLDAVAGLGPAVTPDSFDEHRDRNWCVYRKPTDVEASDVEAALTQLDPAATAEVTRRVRQELTLAQGAAALESQYTSVLEEAAEEADGSPVSPPPLEAAALVEYFRFLAARTRENDTAFAEARRAARQAEKIPALRDELTASRSQHRALIGRLEASWWGRRWLRRHRGWQKPPSA